MLNGKAKNTAKYVKRSEERRVGKECSKAWKDPCSGLGIETTISSRKIGEDKMKQIINIIK